ncbi:MAG: M1 family aminopeptidase [bacterium]
MGALRAIEIMNDSLDLFSQWFGPLHDYQGFCIIEIPEGWGSQADVTSIIQTAAAFKNPEQIYQLYHEVSHQWNVKLLDPAPSRFESEGLAMFLQYLVQEQLGNKRDAVKNAAERYCESFRKACKNNPKCKDVAVIDYGKENLTDLSYTKGMVLFYILYELTGDDQFKEIIGSFYRKYNTTGATSEDFVEHFKLLAKVDLTQFFDEWVYGIKSSEYIIKGVPVEDMVRIYKK